MFGIHHRHKEDEEIPMCGNHLVWIVDRVVDLEIAKHLVGRRRMEVLRGKAGFSFSFSEMVIEIREGRGMLGDVQMQELDRVVEVLV